MNPYGAYTFAHDRAVYLVDLYDLLHNRRQRAARSDWVSSFKELMHWNQGDEVHRVDGDNCILVMRNPSDWTMQHFAHDHLSELLRSAIVCGVSAMDRFFHDVVLDNSLKLLRRADADVPKTLREVKLSLIDADAAIAHALKGRANGARSRPRNTLKARLAEALHQHTFQSSSGVEHAMGMLGLGKPWGDLSRHMQGSAEDVKARLNGIVRRRNQIVHEGDLVRTARPQSPKMHDAVSATVRDDLDWLKSLVTNVNNRVQAEL